jgi:hypothetical protein
MKKIIIALLCLLLCSYGSWAQPKNSIQLHGSNFYTKGLDGKHLAFNTLGISYTRQISKRMALSASYFLPNWNYKTSMEDGSSVRLFSVDNYIVRPWESAGKIGSRYDYQFIDIGAHYQLVKRKHSVLSFQQALSVGIGKDARIPQLPSDYIIPENNIDLCWTGRLYYENPKLAAHLGGASTLHYNYYFYKQRVNIGVNLGTRYYFNSFPPVVHLGLQAGFNF